jgi:uncharacterized protein YecT (DUF1311 family)
MLKLALWPLLCGCVLLVDAPMSNGQEPDVDCDNAMTQMDMNICAGEDFQAADQALNAQYKITRDEVRKRDADASEATKGAEDALVAAQRAWIAYRDAHCASQAFQVRGGSMEPMVIAGCRAALTRQRTEEIKGVTEGP